MDNDGGSTSTSMTPTDDRSETDTEYDSDDKKKVKRDHVRCPLSPCGAMVTKKKNDKKTDKTEEGRQTPKVKRHRVRCPISGCGAKVPNLPRLIRSYRHKKSFHGIQHKAQYIRNLFPQTKKQAKCKRHICPHCESQQTNLSRHVKSCQVNINEDCIQIVYDSQPNPLEDDTRIVDFGNFLTGPDHNREKEEVKSSKNMLIRYCVLAKVSTAEELLDQTVLRLGYENLKSKGLKSTSLNNYLRVVSKFMDFTQFCIPNLAANAAKLSVLLNTWLKCVAKQRYQHQIKCINNLVTHDDMKKFEGSPVVKCCITFLRRASRKSHEQNKAKAIETDMCDTRAMLSVKLACENGQRAGAIAGLTMPQWDTRTTHTDCTVTVIVFNHKTEETQGPMTLTMSPELAS